MVAIFRIIFVELILHCTFWQLNSSLVNPKRIESKFPRKGLGPAFFIPQLALVLTLTFSIFWSFSAFSA